MGRRRPPLTVGQTLAWADAHHARTGRWPSANAGPVAEAPGERWRNIEAALYDGGRGLPGGDTLARLLDRSRRGKPGGPPRRAGWTPTEDEPLRALPPAEAARRTGRNLAAVYQRRHVLGIGPVRRWRT
jgi:hypothetical protein